MYITVANLEVLRNAVTNIPDLLWHDGPDPAPYLTPLAESLDGADPVAFAQTDRGPPLAAVKVARMPAFAPFVGDAGVWRSANRRNYIVAWDARGTWLTRVVGPTGAELLRCYLRRKPLDGRVLPSRLQIFGQYDAFEDGRSPEAACVLRLGEAGRCVTIDMRRPPQPRFPFWVEGYCPELLKSLQEEETLSQVDGAAADLALEPPTEG